MSAAITPIGMPKWGLAMTEGIVTSWLVPPGATITAGQEIAEIETSKITNVFESPASGVLRRRIAEEGQTLPVGALLGVLAAVDVPDAEIDAFVASFLERQEAAAAAAPASPEPQVVQVDGAAIRYLRMGEGDADPLVLIHGFGGDLNNWQFNHAVLAETRPVYAIDLPGHGGSTKSVGAADVAGLASVLAKAFVALNLQRVHLAGHSLGGAIALRLALDAPKRVASVTLVCSAGLGPEVEMAYIEGFIAADRRKEMKAAVELLFADPALISRDMLEDLVRYKRVDGVKQALRKIADAIIVDGRQASVLADQLATLPMPVQAIWGELDRILPARHAEAIPASRRHVLPGAGHMVHLERAPDVNRLILDFVAAA